MSQQIVRVDSTNPLMVTTLSSPNNPVPASPANYPTAAGANLLVRIRRSALMPLVIGPA